MKNNLASWKINISNFLKCSADNTRIMEEQKRKKVQQTSVLGCKRAKEREWGVDNIWIKFKWTNFKTDEK